MGRWSSRRSGGRALPLLDDRLLATRARGDRSSNKRASSLRIALHLRRTPAHRPCCSATAIWPPPQGKLTGRSSSPRQPGPAGHAGPGADVGGRAGLSRPEHRHKQGRRAQTRTAALAHEPSVTVPLVAGIRPGSPRGCAARPAGQRARRELLPAAEPTATPPSARPATRSPARWSPARAGCGASLIAPWSAPTSRPRACPAQPDQPAEVRRWPSRS